MVGLEVEEVMDSEEFAAEHGDEYIDHGLAASILHHEGNVNAERNRHAVKMGETVVLLRVPEEEVTEGGG